MESKEEVIIYESFRRYESRAKELLRSGKVRCIGVNIEDVYKDLLVVFVAEAIIRSSAESN